MAHRIEVGLVTFFLSVLVIEFLFQFEWKRKKNIAITIPNIIFLIDFLFYFLFSEFFF